MIICFEGPSAIGKTTLCEALNNNFTSIPEVNLLFKRPKNEPKYWYLDKQLERTYLCKTEKKSTILDGDPFQPLWYNWIYKPENYNLQLDATLEFYTNAIHKKKITFPDLYIVFNVEYETLLTRKENDNSRKRSNFMKHQSLILNQQLYFKFLKDETNLNIIFITYNSVDQAKHDVLLAVKEYRNPELIDQSRTILHIAEWLKNNNPMHTPEY
ncbi:hypothetical protein [Formosa sp. PL04]|uniref:hypothetical protein n=1 Tax=Formosa sp. PL04 TaxID=3081755 RepID=UPI0029823A73|nr:hypothetical protein [Formosa sp. PL04]MDW5289244.1 hypothetical protein [Formosa sp. PL04]